MGGLKYIRVATFPVNEILPLIFTRAKRQALKELGYAYDSKEWKQASVHKFQYSPENYVNVTMGSHKYQLFAEKGCTCVSCGLTGTFFAVERGKKDRKGKFHLNLYGVLPNGEEMMITKDHIIPRSAGGKNMLLNYQPMCKRCNSNKADKV